MKLSRQHRGELVQGRSRAVLVGYMDDVETKVTATGSGEWIWQYPTACSIMKWRKVLLYDQHRSSSVIALGSEVHDVVAAG